MEKKYAMEVEVLSQGGEGRHFDFDPVAVAGRVCQAVLAKEGCPYDTDVFLLVTDGDEVRRLNLEHRGLDRTTDVLSFPAVDFSGEADFSCVRDQERDCLDPETGRLQLGDIVINADRVWDQAADYGHSPRREFAFLVAHSMLHLCGYDHMEAEEAGRMEARQEAVLQELGITRDADA